MEENDASPTEHTSAERLIACHFFGKQKGITGLNLTKEHMLIYPAWQTCLVGCMLFADVTLLSTA